MISKLNGEGHLWKKAISDSSHYMISTLCLKLMSFLVIPILTRSFSIEEFALYDLFLSFYAFLFIVLGLGLDSGTAILLTDSKGEEQKLSFILVVSLVSSLCASVLFLFISLAFLSIRNDTLFTLEQWVVLCLYTTVGLQSYLMVNFCRFNGQVKSAAYASLASSLVGMCGGIIYVIYFDGAVIEYLYALLFGACFGLFVCLVILRKTLLNFKMKKPEAGELKELFALSFPFVPNYVGNSLIQLTDRFIVLAILDLKALGIYALASRIASIPAIAVSVVSKGFLPVLLRNHTSESGRAFSRQVFHFYVVCLPICVVASFFVSDELVALFGGDKFAEVSAIIPIMMCSVLVFASTYMGGFGFVIKRKTYQIAYLTYFSLAVNLVASYFLGIYYGMLGVVLGTLLASILRAMLYMKCSERLYLFGYRLNLVGMVFLTTAFLSLLLNKLSVP